MSYYSTTNHCSTTRQYPEWCTPHNPHPHLTDYHRKTTLLQKQTRRILRLLAHRIALPPPIANLLATALLTSIIFAVTVIFAVVIPAYYIRLSRIYLHPHSHAHSSSPANPTTPHSHQLQSHNLYTTSPTSRSLRPYFPLSPLLHIALMLPLLKYSPLPHRLPMPQTPLPAMPSPHGPLCAHARSSLS